MNSLPIDILGFKQLEEESIGAAWARFLRLLASSPDLSLPEDVSLNIFCSSLGMKSALNLDVVAGGSFAQITPTEGREILDFLLENSSFPTNHNEPIQQECESRQEDLPVAESSPSTSTSLDSVVELMPGPGTSEEEEIQPPKSYVRFEDEPLRNTSNHLRHEEPTKLMCLYKTLDEISRHTPAMDWSKEAKRASEAIRISPTSATITCSMKGNIVEALHDPVAEICIITECLLDTLVGHKPLTQIDKYFKSLSGQYFECRGIARDVPIIIDKIEVRLDFHIYDILDFDLFLGYPLEKLLASQGSLDEKLRETGSATATPRLENILAKPLPEQNPLEEILHTYPFISSEPVLLGVLESSEEYDSKGGLHSCEDERLSSSLTEFDLLPNGLESVVLDLDRDTSMIFYDESLKMENQWAIEFCEAPTLESNEKDSTNEHGSFTL